MLRPVAVIVAATAGLLLAARTDVPAARAQSTAPTIKAVGTEFVLTAGGRVLRSRDLVGAVLTVAGADGKSQAIRIESVEPDPADPDILLHTLSVQDAATGAWGNLCATGSD